MPREAQVNRHLASCLVVVLAIIPMLAVARTQERNMVYGNDPEGKSRKPIRRVAPPIDPAPTEITYASWNVENLFDFEDNPHSPGDNQYTPRGWTHWYIYRYVKKIANIAEIISEMEPDIIVLCEVENRRVLEDLCDVLEDKYNWPMPYIIHKESPDFRGIDVAVLSRYKPTLVTWVKNGGHTRLSPMVDFDIGGRPLTIIGNHWKSRLGGKDESDKARAGNAQRVRKSYLHVLGVDPSRAILASGDFNDNYDDAAPMIHGGFSTNISEVLEGGTNLFCLSTLLKPEDRGTFYYSQSRTWFSFDTINVSRGLLQKGEPASPWYVATRTYRVYKTAKQTMETNNIPFPFRRVGTPTGHKIMNGYSDHFPVIVKIRARDDYIPNQAPSAESVQSDTNALVAIASMMQESVASGNIEATKQQATDPVAGASEVINAETKPNAAITQ